MRLAVKGRLVTLAGAASLACVVPLVAVPRVHKAAKPRAKQRK